MSAIGHTHSPWVSNDERLWDDKLHVGLGHLREVFFRNALLNRQLKAENYAARASKWQLALCCPFTSATSGDFVLQTAMQLTQRG